MSLSHGFSKVDKSSDPLFGCFICSTRFPGRFIRLVKTSKPSQSSSHEEEYFPFLSIQWSSRSVGDSQPAPASEVPCCVFCCKDLHEQWVMYNKRETPIDKRQYQTRRNIHQVQKDGSGVCYLCGSISRLSTMYRLSISYYPFLSSYPLPYGASDTDLKGRVVTCEPCRSMLYTQWNRFETEHVQEPNRVYRIKIGSNEVRVSATSLPPRVKVIEPGVVGSLQTVTKPQPSAMVHATSVLGQKSAHIHSQAPVVSTSQVFGRKVTGVPISIVLSTQGLQKGPIISSASGPANRIIGVNRKQLPQGKVSGNMSSSLTQKPANSLSHLMQLSGPPTITGTEQVSNVRLVSLSDNTGESRDINPDGMSEQPKGTCYLCGIHVSLNLLSLVSTIYNESDVGVSSFYSFLWKLPPAVSAQRHDGLGRVYVCIDCHANLTVLERVHSIKSTDGISDVVLNDVACFRCGAVPGKDKLWYLSCRLTKSGIPYFPSLYNAPRAQGSRPVDKNGRLIVCFSCRDECYVKFYEYWRQNVNVEARSYLPNFCCYMCGANCQGDVMKWISSYPNDQTGQQDCYPFILNLKPMRGTAMMNRNGCALVCGPCKDHLYAQFLTMEQARVPLRFRSYMVNGRVFQPPADIPKSIASQATFINLSSSLSSSHSAISATTTTSKSDLMMMSHSQALSTSIPAVSASASQSGLLVKKDLAIQNILNSQPKLAPKPVSGELELAGPPASSLSSHLSTVFSSEVNIGANVSPAVKSFIINVSAPGQSGKSFVQTTTTNTHVTETLLSSTTGTSQVVTEQEKQQRLQEQQHRFRTQIDKLQQILSQRSQQLGSLSKDEVAPDANEEAVGEQGTPDESDNTVTSWKHDCSEALVQTQNHAKAVAKHSEEKLTFFHGVGLVAKEEIDRAKKSSSVVVSYPFIEEPIPVDSADEGGVTAGMTTRNRMRLMRSNQFYSVNEVDGDLTPPRIDQAVNYRRLISSRSGFHVLSQNEDMDHFETEPRAKRACYNINEKRLNERHRRQKLIAGLETNQRSRQKRKRKETSQSMAGVVCCICSGSGGATCSGCNQSYHSDCLDLQGTQIFPVGQWLCPRCTDWASQGPGPDAIRWPGVLSIVRSVYTLSAERTAESRWLHGSIKSLEVERANLGKELDRLTRQVMDLIGSKNEGAEADTRLSREYSKLTDMLKQLRRL